MPTISLTAARGRDIAGVRRRNIGLYTGPASYVTGGEAFVAGDVGLGRLEFVDFELANDGTDWYGITYDYTNGTAIWVVLSSGNQVANGVDLSGFTARFEAVGL